MGESSKTRAWWDRNQELVEQNLLRAMQDGTAERGTAQKFVKESRESKNITIRMPLADLERTRSLSARKGLAYQTYMKMLLHEALDRKKTASRNFLRRTRNSVRRRKASPAVPPFYDPRESCH